MLKKLLIRSFRVVESLAFEPGGGLNVITGETGAGKSLLVGALEAALGSEVTKDDVRDLAETAAIVAEFEIAPDSHAFTKLNELIPGWQGPSLVMERRIHSSSRSSCRVQGKQVSREFLSRAGAWLVDFHGQHSHQLLLTPSSQLEILDEFAGFGPKREVVAQAHKRWQELKRLVQERKAWLERARREREERAFQLAELRQLNLRHGERAELEKDLKILATGQDWKETCIRARQTLMEEDGSVAERLVHISRDLEALGAHFPELKSGLVGLESSIVEIQEFTDVIRHIGERLTVDPARQSEIEERLAALIGLEKRFGRDEAGLIELRQELEHAADVLTRADEDLRALEIELEGSRNTLEEQAAELSMGRLRAAEQFVPRVEAELALLGLERARLIVRLEPLPVRDGFAGDGSGKERAMLLFSSALEEEPKELARVASGGELSRIMLALKTVLGDSDPVGAMVFDEIDTGVGGGLAAVVGERLQALGAERQVICITHLAPVASRAAHHFVVEKDVRERVSIQIRRLSPEKRINEVARMLGGFPLSDEALRHAEALLDKTPQGGSQ